MTELSFCDWLDKEVAERTDITESTREHHRTMAGKVRESRIFATFKDLTLPNIIRFDDAIKKTYPTLRVEKLSQAIKTLYCKSIAIGVHR